MIAFVVFIVFLVLRLTGVIEWSWWWVTAPLWLSILVPIVLDFLGIAVSGALLSGAWLVSRDGRKAIADWHRRHLNWTFVLAYLLWWTINLYADVSEIAWWVSLAAAIFWLIISGWVLKQKGRSLWWLLLAWVGSPLWLRNKRNLSESTKKLEEERVDQSIRAIMAACIASEMRAGRSQEEAMRICQEKIGRQLGVDQRG